MPPRLVQVRHKVTGRKAVLAETALRFFPDYVKTTRQERLDRARATKTPAAAPADDTKAALSASQKEN